MLECTKLIRKLLYSVLNHILQKKFSYIINVILSPGKVDQSYWWIYKKKTLLIGFLDEIHGKKVLGIQLNSFGRNRFPVDC